MASSTASPRVCIITWCNSADHLYGSTLVFDSIRVGFPDSDILVVENASEPEVQGPIREAAEAAGCEVRQLEERRPHWALVESLALEEDRPTVIVDPDVMFWERVSGWDFGGALIAGRLLPEFADPFTDTLTLPRLHTSHLWFPRPAELRARIEQIQRRHFEAGSLFQPRMMPPGWWRWDTAAALYLALGPEAVAFSEAQLDSYDHLFCGSHLYMVLPSMDPQSRALMLDAHARAQSDPASLKGIWRLQEVYFSSRPWSGKISV